MTTQELAKKLDGRQHRDEINEEEESQAKENGIVIVFGASDDLIEFRGAIYDEVGAYDGGKAFLTSNGLVENMCDDDDCPYFKEQLKKAKTIEESRLGAKRVSTTENRV